MRLLLTTLGISLLLPPAFGQSCPTESLVDVLTHRSNNFRTGANLHETCLTWDNVGSLRRRFTLNVNGQVYAQPLIKTNLLIHGEKRNLVFIATMENWVYAFDADGKNPDAPGQPQQPYWARYLGRPVPITRIPWDIGANALGQLNVYPVIGVTSTPVIDPDTKTIFVVAKLGDPEPSPGCAVMPSTTECPIEYRIYAIEIETGNIVDVKKIDLGPIDDGDKNRVCDKREIQTSELDSARILFQRAALLMTGKAPDLHIYLGFGSHQDAHCPVYHGRLVRFDFDGEKLKQYAKPFLVTRPNTPGPAKGGIWQAGNGPAADADGNIYVMTGNGAYNPGQDFSNTLLKLDPDLKPIAWFASRDIKRLSSDFWDVDYGASGPVLVPGMNQIFGGGKQGEIYLVDTKPSGQTLSPVQGFWAARGWSTSFTRIVIGATRLSHVPVSWVPGTFATGYHHIHGAPAFWGDKEGSPAQSALFVWPERDHLRVFGYRKDLSQTGRFLTKPLQKGPKNGPGMPGGFLSISANKNPSNGEMNGILWAALPLNEDAWVSIVPGALRAFKITPDGGTLATAWTSFCSEPQDDKNKYMFAKYVPPTVANGWVYLPTFSNYVIVYGPGDPSAPAANPDCPPPPAPPKAK